MKHAATTPLYAATSLCTQQIYQPGFYQGVTPYHQVPTMYYPYLLDSGRGADQKQNQQLACWYDHSCQLLSQTTSLFDRTASNQAHLQLHARWCITKHARTRSLQHLGPTSHTWSTRPVAFRFGFGSGGRIGICIRFFFSVTFKFSIFI